MSNQNFRIGQIVPSSNVTMETEIPALLRAREQVEPERFTFHSARMRMKNVTREELEAMDAESDRCARSQQCRYLGFHGHVGARNDLSDAKVLLAHRAHLQGCVPDCRSPRTPV